jgi:flagellar basal-body rod protein FlgG
MTIPQNATDIVVNETGQVYVRLDSQTELQLVGQFTLGNFVNEVGLEPMGGNLYRETLASGTVTLGVAGDPGFATVHQGYLENSNVDPVKEITELISAQRAYEMNSKVIQAADDMFATVAKNLR